MAKKKQNPAMDPELRRLVSNLGKQVEDRYVDVYGEIDKKGMHAAILDEFEEEYMDVVPVALRGGWSFFVWEVLRKDFGGTRGKGVAEMMHEDESESAEPRLPSEEWAQTAVYSVPVGGGKHATKRLDRMSTEEVRSTRREYEKRGREMFQQARPLAAYEKEMDRREFGPTDTVRDLYKRSA